MGRGVSGQSAQPSSGDENDGLVLLRTAFLGIVRHDVRDLTTRQLAVFLTCYLEGDDHTVRGLAARLKVRKPVNSRVLNRLEGLGFAKRKMDPGDRRSIVVSRTVAGAGFLRDLGKIMRNAPDTGWGEGTVDAAR